MIFEELWASLTPEQKKGMKDIAGKVLVADTRTKIFQKLFGSDKLSNETKVFLLLHKFNSLDDVKSFGIENLESLMGYSQNISQNIENAINQNRESKGAL
jgi:hypothetical protein